MKVSYKLNEIEPVAKQLIDNATAKTLLFYGNMGTGKTTLIKAIVKALGSDDEVSSPTFSIVNEYKLNNDKIYHFDLYRIEDIGEAYNFGIEDYLDSDNWKLIEWPDIIKPIISEHFNIVNLDLNSNTERRLELCF